MPPALPPDLPEDLPPGTRLDALPEAEARSLLTSCLAAPGWVEGMLADRPYPDVAAALEHARVLAGRLDAADVEAALARHPRIADRPGPGQALSAAEQAGVDAEDPEVVAALRAGNATYEARFGRVFLVRAAGRTGPELMAELRRRLDNPDDVEAREVAGQLGEIALLRLEQQLAAGPETGSVSTHVLDATRGCPGAGVPVTLARVSEPADPVAAAVTDADGRVADLAAGLPAGTYRLSLDTAAYFAATGTPTFYPRVEVVFILGDGHHHVPVLLSPFAFSTYRGS